MFTPKHIKEAKALCKAARRVCNYERDRARPAELALVEERLASLKEVIKRKSGEQIAAAQKDLLDALEPVHRLQNHHEIRENVELLLVAIVLALGIRAFYLQPFRIPTGSMQPTLNGVIAHRIEEPPPNFLVRTFQFLLLGRSYENIVCETEGDQITNVRPQKVKMLWDGSALEMASGRVYQVGISPEVLGRQLGLYRGRIFHRNEPILRAYADLGDQLFVDKVSYNFVKPGRGDVFVFKTNQIAGIESGPQGESEHYIKRLAGLPLDTLQIKAPFLFVNGREAEEYPFRREAAQKNGYPGYVNDIPGTFMLYLNDPNATFPVPPHAYFALGDNSPNSADSRFWGPVPEQNLVGRGLFVYWPFTSHWGFIR